MIWTCVKNKNNDMIVKKMGKIGLKGNWQRKSNPLKRRTKVIEEDISMACGVNVDREGCRGKYK